VLFKKEMNNQEFNWQTSFDNDKLSAILQMINQFHNSELISKLIHFVIQYSAIVDGIFDRNIINKFFNKNNNCIEYIGFENINNLEYNDFKSTDHENDDFISYVNVVFPNIIYMKFNTNNNKNDVNVNIDFENELQKMNEAEQQVFKAIYEIGHNDFKNSIGKLFELIPDMQNEKTMIYKMYFAANNPHMIKFRDLFFEYIKNYNDQKQVTSYYDKKNKQHCINLNGEIISEEILCILKMFFKVQYSIACYRDSKFLDCNVGDRYLTINTGLELIRVNM
jgi:hypothetical protein